MNILARGSKKNQIRIQKNVIKKKSKQKINDQKTPNTEETEEEEEETGTGTETEKRGPMPGLELMLLEVMMFWR